MSLLNRVQQMKNDASVLENSCESIYREIKNVEPFEGPGLQKNLRQIEADVTKLLRKAKGLAEINAGKVTQDDATEINDLWGEIAASLECCEASLSAGREYLENESILVFLSTVIKDIGFAIRDTIKLVGSNIKGLLEAGQ
jgi:hypothetical protein